MGKHSKTPDNYRPDNEVLDWECIDGYIIEMRFEDCPENPREWGYCGCTILHWHSRRDIGDERINTSRYEAENIGELVAEVSEEYDFVYAWPMFAYEHGGIALSLGADVLVCPFDSGVAGIVGMTADQAKNIGIKDREHAYQLCEAEVREFSAYCNGEVYSYQILGPSKPECSSCGYTEGREVEEGCSGYYSLEDAWDAAKDTVRYLLEQDAKERDSE